MKTKVLIAATGRWFPTARLAMAFGGADCTVDAVCPPNHPLDKIRPLGAIHTYRGLSPTSSLASAIAKCRPNIVIPFDDLAVAHLHDLYRVAQRQGSQGAQLCGLIERSLGSPTSYPVVLSRTPFIEVAREMGVRVPEAQVIRGIEDLRNWAARVGFPVVLKADRTSGGEGVRLVGCLKDAERAFAVLNRPPLLARAAKRALFDDDTNFVWPSILRRGFVVNAQSFIPGNDATSLVACWNGTVLASLHFQVLNKCNSSGPASVLRLTENAEMSDAVRKMVSRLKLSGLHGFDFILEPGTGHATLLEINPRATQVGHLTLGVGRDLPGALAAAVSGTPIREAPRVTENAMIALFPQEWRRDPESSFLKSAYHDVPWEEPDLVRACVRRRQSLRALYSHKQQIRAFSAAHIANS